MARDRTLGLKLRAIDRMSNVIDRVQRKFPKLTRSIRRGSRAAQIFNAQTKRMRANLLKIGQGLRRFGSIMTIGVTLPVIAATGAGVKMFAEYQQGLRGVEKTTGLSRNQVAKMGDVFDRLSTKIPVSTKEMLDLAKAGGQLGVKGTANLEKFAITMAKLGRASDVAGEEGAKSIARILTVTGDGIGKVERFSSALVELGNNAAAGEREILAVAVRVAGQIGRFDVASDKVLGISTALKALGKNAESSGSVVGRSFDAIDQSIRKGGDAALLLSKLTGISVKQLKVQFEQDAAKVFQKFVEGLNKVEKGGGNMIKVLEFMGLQGVRINDVLGTLAKNPKVLAINMDRATRAFKDNVALQKEFAIQIDSLGSEITTLMNTFTRLLRLIGSDLAPVVRFFGDILKSIFKFLADNPTIRALVLTFALLAAVMAPVLTAFGFFLIILPGLITGAGILGIALIPLAIKFLVIGLAIGALVAVGVILFKQWQNIKDFFNENPFGKFLKFIFLMFTPLGQMITLVRLVIASFSGLDAVKNVLRDTLPTFVADKLFGKEKGARREASGAGRRAGGDIADSIKGKIGVNFSNIPAGTNIKAESEGPIGLDLGFAGALQ